MSDETESFDWSPLGESWWTEAAATTGASVLQARFACCRHRGMTATLSAKLAGYSGSNDSIRQVGSRTSKTTAVMNILALAVAETGQGDENIVGGAEARRILSRLARGSDPNVRIKAIESLNKFEERDREITAAKSALRSPQEDLDEMAERYGVDVARRIADCDGIDWRPRDERLQNGGTNAA